MALGLLGIVGIVLNYFPRSFVSSFRLVGQFFLPEIRAQEQPFDEILQQGVFRQICVFRNSRITSHVSLLSIYFGAFKRLYIDSLV